MDLDSKSYENRTISYSWNKGTYRILASKDKCWFKEKIISYYESRAEYYEHNCDDDTRRVQIMFSVNVLLSYFVASRLYKEVYVYLR